MNPSPRHSRILALLEEEGTISISELANRLAVSVETVRRDVKPLAARGAVIRMHGAVALPSHVGEAPIEKRVSKNRAGDVADAPIAAETVAGGKSVMVDTGTTNRERARELVGY